MPQLWVFAGPNGAGKSTLVARYLRERLPIINPDLIALRIGMSRQGTAAIIEAGKIAVRERAALLNAGESFAIETTLSGNSEIRLMRDASSANYKVNLVFVGVDVPETSVSRVAHRFVWGCILFRRRIFCAGTIAAWKIYPLRCGGQIAVWWWITRAGDFACS
jgi:predicted ABC-type ATPase